MRRLHLPLTVLSPTNRSCCYATTSALVFLSFISLSPPSPSLSCLRIRLLFSIQYMPIPLQPTFLHFLEYFSHLRCLSNSFIPDSVQLGDSTYPCSMTCHYFMFIQCIYKEMGERKSKHHKRKAPFIGEIRRQTTHCALKIKHNNIDLSAA